MTGLLVVGCSLAGLAVGSFLNVVVWRVPRRESVVRPGSHCPACATPIQPRDNVPILSWLRLRGRCRSCTTQISARYPLVELATCTVFVALGLRFGLDPALPAYLYLGAVCVALTLIDLDVKRLPNVLTLPSYVVGAVLLGVAAATGAGPGPLVRALLGMTALYAVYFVLAVAYPAGMGFGDVKLAGVLGLYTAWLGWGSWAVGAFLGFALGGVVAVGLLVVGRAGRKTALPFGPFMIAGALLSVLAGQDIATAYLRVTVGG